MDTVLAEVTNETIDAKHVQRRVDDWEARLNALFAAIGDWLPNGWEARQGAPVLMHEKMMRRFGVEAKPMPTLELHGGAGQVVRFEPHALWVIGNNGRIDVKRGARRYLIVDAAENFGKPDWRVMAQECRNEWGLTRFFLSERHVMRATARFFAKR